MVELRSAKLDAASSGGGRGALASFNAIATRLEVVLRDNAAAVGVLDTTMRKGLNAADARLTALEGGLTAKS